MREAHVHNWKYENVRESLTRTATQESSKKSGKPRDGETCFNKEIKVKTDTEIYYWCGCAESRLEPPEFWERKCDKHSQ